ncbi:C6 domain-containing protein [Caenorhabditis elegans]|uniref:C6 domain-containing protein n=1 Tax=Caenorhabditis elegans TaxID=6239 RepID=Q4R131_CAEEL|nr:C6 domain-containing protein [Caenorhabditis elegans]CCD64030.1 C6 domain-containing protein [Caenorhabditis elegans]|eukprot:NP_001033393.1 Uncharacterized protein CELE_C09G12.17 [Caenorhabditis elegans]
MRILLVLFPIFLKFSDSCAPTSTTTPIVCPCTTSEVELLNRIDGSPEGTESIQPVGSVTTADSNGCPTVYSITCNPPDTNPTATVSMMFQDQISGPITGPTLSLTCTDGNWLYLDEFNGQTLVVSVSCQWSP